MNSIIAYPTLIAATLLSTAAAQSSAGSIYVFSVTGSEKHEHKEKPPAKNRMPARPLVCTVSPEGITIASVSTDDIVLFEVCNADGECLASFTSELDFISFIYETKGTVEIRLHTKDSIFHGFLDL